MNLIKPGIKSRLVLIILLTIVYWISARLLFPVISTNTLELKSLKQMENIPFSLKLPFVKVPNNGKVLLIGDGKIKLPANFKRDDNADLIILHGTDADKLKTVLSDEKILKTKNIIITAMALKTLLLHENGEFILPFLDNFQKSGDIKNSQGNKFYYMEELSFLVKENLGGIILSFPEGKYFTKVKNYGLAHLIQNNFSLEGLMNPVKFLESLGFPKPKGFKGSFEDLIKQAGTEYQKKFKSNVILMNFAQGRRISPELIPMMQAKKNAKFLPLIEAVKLSDNIWFSGLTKE